MNVTALTVGIKAVEPVYRALLDLSTAGELSRRLEKMRISDLLHPFIIIRMSNGTALVYERVKRIRIEPIDNVYSDDGDVRLFLPATKLNNKTLYDLYKNHVNIYGGSFDSIAQYRPTDQNSQVFVEDFLRANGLANTKLSAFFKQPTEQIMRGLPRTADLINRITSLGLSLDVLVGRGHSQ